MSKYLSRQSVPSGRLLRLAGIETAEREITERKNRSESGDISQQSERLQISVIPGEMLS